MDSLRLERCVACHRGAPQVPDEDISQLHPSIPNWTLTREDDIRRLHREFKCLNFKGALDFSVQIGEMAEAEGHHPRITLEWGKVTVDWWTHKIRGLHRNDFIMAAKTDQAFHDIAD